MGAVPDPAREVADRFMAHKGYGELTPQSIDSVDGENLWYFVYDLPDGDRVELEVSWHEADGWNANVSAFQSD